jgi:hypothetical protein
MQHLKSPSGKVISTKGKTLAQVLRAEGCQDTTPPKSKKDKKGTYYTDHAFTHGY